MNFRYLLISLAFLLAASYFAFFLHLGSAPLYMWDEARNAVHAVEMLETGNFSVKTNQGIPDFAFDTKPPFVVWTIALSMKIFGMNELGLRFPSALMGLLTVIMLFFFVIKYLKSLKTAVMCWLVLITSLGFIGEHVSRTGDYDAMLVFWITSYSLLYFLFLDSTDAKRKRKYFFLFSIALVFATMTKGVAAMLFLPGLLLYTAWQKKIVEVLKNWVFYGGILFFILAVFTYYAMLESATPGYLDSVFNREISSYKDVIDGHRHPFGFYFNNFFSTSMGEGIGSYARFSPWLFFIPCCSFFMLISKNERVRNLGIFSLAVVIPYFLLISFSNTKLTWYDAPLFPFFALIIGLGLNEMLILMSYNHTEKRKSIEQLAVLFIIVSIFLSPYLNIFSINYKPREPGWDQVKYGGFFKKLAKEKSTIKEFKVVNFGENMHLLFYVKTYNKKGYDIRVESNSDYLLNVNDTVVTCIWDEREKVKARYHCEIIMDDRYCTACIVKGIKQ